MIIAVRMLADDGVANQIDVTDTLNQAYFDALVQHTDASKRWYPISELETVVQERGESINQSYDSGRTIKIQDGFKTFSALKPEAEYAYLGKIEAFGCHKIGIYIVDIADNLKGEITTDAAYLRPMEVAAGTWDVRYSEATDTKTNEIMLNFQFAKSVSDSDLRMIVPSEMNNISLLDLEGLKDVNGTHSAISVTGVTSVLSLDYGTAVTPVAVEGLAFGSIDVRNTTTLTDYAASAAVEAPAGTYAIVFATAPSGTYNVILDSATGYAAKVVGTFIIP
tara:strand:+ start:202 stop:1038 length:837 start_codon:yes stop_codon:yes gene_type:complete